MLHKVKALLKSFVGFRKFRVLWEKSPIGVEILKISKPEQPSCVKKVCGPKNAVLKKRCEIQSDRQEIAVMEG